MPGEEPEENLNIVNSSDYSARTDAAMKIISERDISFEIIEAVLKHIKTLAVPGAVLIFLPGWNVIFALMKFLQQHPEFGE